MCFTVKPRSFGKGSNFATRRPHRNKENHVYNLDRWFWNISVYIYNMYIYVCVFPFHCFIVFHQEKLDPKRMKKHQTIARNHYTSWPQSQPVIRRKKSSSKVLRGVFFKLRF